MSSEVLAFDKERRPELPFRRCDGPADGCHIGSGSPSEFQPSILFWGDSHMLARAPVIDAVLKEKGIAATLKVSSACPPMFGVENKKKVSCRRFGNGVKESIESGEFDAVILAALLVFFFIRQPVHSYGGGVVIADALPQTLQIIQAEELMCA